MNFYTKLPDMECLSGDTLPAFHIQVTGGVLASATMKIILARKQTPDIPAVTKDCTAETGGFSVQLTEAEKACRKSLRTQSCRRCRKWDLIYQVSVSTMI